PPAPGPWPAGPRPPSPTWPGATRTAPPSCSPRPWTGASTTWTTQTTIACPTTPPWRRSATTRGSARCWAIGPESRPRGSPRLTALTEPLAGALRCFQEGRLHEAEGLCRQVLQGEPANADALHLLGVLAHRAGEHGAAVALLRQAVAARPGDGEFHYNLG